MTDNTTVLTLKGKIAYEEEISAAQAAQIIAFLNAEEGEASRSVGPSFASRPGSTGARKLAENAREAIALSGAKTNPEKIVALAAYVLQDGGDTVKPDAIKSQFQRAREVTPAKFSRDLSAAITSGWIAEGGGEELYLTKSVEGIFDQGFVFPKSNSSPRPRTTKAAKSRAGKPESLADVDAFDSVMEGYPSYSKLKSGKDRLLWVLVYMRDVYERKSLSNKEVEWITDHIGTGIPNSNITGAFNSAKSGGLAIRSTQDNSIKVTDSGADYLSGLGNGEEG